MLGQPWAGNTSASDSTGHEVLESLETGLCLRSQFHVNQHVLLSSLKVKVNSQKRKLLFLHSSWKWLAAPKGRLRIFLFGMLCMGAGEHR